MAGHPAPRGHLEFFGAPTMDATSLIIVLAIGAIAGWLAGLLMRGGGFGVLGNVVVGIIGGYAFGVLGITAGGLIGSIVTATVGAVILLLLVGLLKKAA